MNAPIIVDTSAVISLVSQTDSNHAHAETIGATVAASGRTLLVPEEVFTETVNTLGKKTGHDTAAAVGQRLQTSGEFTIMETTPTLRAAAMVRFETQPKGVSLTDCYVMVFADAFATKEIFGFDEAFAKNGYCLPDGRKAV